MGEHLEPPDVATNEAPPPPALRAARALESAAALDPAADAVQGFVAHVLDGRPALADVLHGATIGHPLHPLLTDLPLGLWTGALALDLVGGEEAHGAADRLLGLGILVAAPTFVSGWADWGVSDGRAVRRAGLVHAALNGAGAVLQGTSWLARRGGHRTAGVALSVTANALLAAAGYLGGHLAFRLGAPTGGPEAAADRSRRDGTAAAAPR